MKYTTLGLAASVLLAFGSLAYAQPVAGCGPESATDPKPIEHTPARCTPGFPAAKPLPQKTTLVITTPLPNGEYFAPIQIGILKGEFEKENLDMQIQVIPSSDAMQLSVQGKVDVIWNSPDAGTLNAIAQGFDIAWVAGNFTPPLSSKQGLWGRKGAKLSDLKGKVVGSAVGAGSMTMLPIDNALRKAGISVHDITLQRLDTGSTATALKNGAVSAAWVLDPLWIVLEKDPDFEFLAGQTPGEPLGGPIFGPNLLRKDRAAGEAFIRAYVRILSTYFNGDFEANPAFLDDLSKALKLPAETIRATPSAVWDWEIRSGTTDRAQAIMMPAKALNYPTPLPEAKVVDRSFYQAVTGRKM